METIQVVLSPSARWTRVLVRQGPDELLRAILPPSSRVRHERAVTTFLEGLSLWLDATLPVVLSVDARQASFCLGLTDELGLGARSVYYRVEVSERGRRQRRGTRIRGAHRRSWGFGEDIEHSWHRDGLLEKKPPRRRRRVV